MPGLVEALHQIFSPAGIILILLGTALGVFVGAVPGLTGAMVIALILPLTHGHDALLSMAFLIAIYVGAVSGGMITATLLRMPGTPASIVTTLDGYPLAKNGHPGRALGLGVMASFSGGMISWLFLVLLTQPVARLSVKFGYFEYFSLVMMALVLIATIGGKSLPKALFAGFLGILCSMPGISAATGEARLTFGFEAMNSGFELLSVLIGLFAVNQIIQEIISIDKKGVAIEIGKNTVFVKLRDFALHGWNMIRSAVIGTWIGILPGIGANIGSLTAYSFTKSLSKEPEKFGTGHEPGIVSAETANNATIGGALIPLLAMGLPGSIMEAVLIGALVMHGLTPGPRLFEQSPDMVYTVMGSMFIANIAMAAIMFFSMGFLAKLIKIPKRYLFPVILCFCVIGALANANNPFDIWVMLGFGLLGFVMEKTGFPLAPFVIGFVLGGIAEENISLGLQSSNGSYAPLLTRPMSAFFLLVAVIMLVVPAVKSIVAKRREAV
ncbi:MAG: tripartite tricarboxylate transporter permease [Verrucomicrobiales bacterium]|nr:tripartite tricarboxylate transporter permease [Verrucomicrobiales bacterium]